MRRWKPPVLIWTRVMLLEGFLNAFTIWLPARDIELDSGAGLKDWRDLCFANCLLGGGLSIMAESEMRMAREMPVPDLVCWLGGSYGYGREFLRWDEYSFGIGSGRKLIE